MIPRAVIAFIALLACNGSSAAGLPTAQTARIDSIMQAGLKGRYYPGASVAIGDRDGILYEACYGWHDYSHSLPVTPHDVYDLASVTKVAATTLAVMRLCDMGKLTPEMTLGAILPEYRQTVLSDLTLRELLSHTSGLGNFSSWSLLFSNGDGGSMVSPQRSEQYPFEVDKGLYRCLTYRPDTALVCFSPREGWRRAGKRCYINPQVDLLLREKIIASYTPSMRGGRIYSDLNFHLLMLVVEQVAGQRLDQFLMPLYRQMRMSSTGFCPLAWMTPESIIPTENDLLMVRGQLCGYVHDDLAAVCGNVGGNAGLFSTVGDMAIFCRMILCGGEIDGQRVVSEATIELFTSKKLLGFAPLTSSPAYEGGYGHTGYTGTMIWIDPVRGLYMVFLSNRVHPTRTNTGLQTSSLRTRLWEAIVAE